MTDVELKEWELTKEDRATVARDQPAVEGDQDRIESKRLRTVMSTPEGREWMWNHLAECNVFHVGFAPDPYVHAFGAGRRNVGLELLDKLHKHAFDLYQSMEIEARKRGT